MSNQFTKQRTDYQGSSYDYASIMHYGATAFSKNGRPTISPKSSGARIGARVMSRKDLDRIAKLYC